MTARVVSVLLGLGLPLAVAVIVVGVAGAQVAVPVAGVLYAALHLALDRRPARNPGKARVRFQVGAPPAPR